MVEDLGEKKEQQIMDLRDKNENLIKELSDLKTNSITEMATLSQKIQKLEDEKDDLKEKFFSADAQAESLKSDLKAKQTNVDQLKQNLLTSQKNLDEQTSEILQLKNEIQLLKDSSKDSLSSEQTKTLSMQATIDTLQVFKKMSSQCCQLCRQWTNFKSQAGNTFSVASNYFVL